MEVSTENSAILEPGTVIDKRYRIVETIGHGGMARVYKAIDMELDHAIVAIKVLNEEFSVNKDYVDRFLREVQLMNLVNHPNVVRTYQGGTWNQMIYFSLEFIDGSSLETLLKEGRFDFSQTRKLISQICSGLKAIHNCDIVHRDLKPGNILILKNGDAKIADFGVARQKRSNLTRVNQKVGSVLYMAPEIWASKELTPAVDFYALGVMLYEMWTKQMPFNGKNPGELMIKHLKETPVSPSEINPEIPEWLERLIVSLLEKSPSQRPSSAEEVTHYLEVVSSGEFETTGPEISPVMEENNVSRQIPFLAISGIISGLFIFFTIKIIFFN